MIAWWVVPVYILIFIAIAIAIEVILALWVYKDAESRGMDGTLWAVLVFFTCFIGLIIYLIVREGVRPTAAPPQIKRICPQCGWALTEDTKFCPHCGKSLEPTTKKG